MKKGVLTVCLFKDEVHKCTTKRTQTNQETSVLKVQDWEDAAVAASSCFKIYQINKTGTPSVLVRIEKNASLSLRMHRWCNKTFVVFLLQWNQWLHLTCEIPWDKIGPDVCPTAVEACTVLLEVSREFGLVAQWLGCNEPTNEPGSTWAHGGLNLGSTRAHFRMSQQLSPAFGIFMWFQQPCQMCARTPAGWAKNEPMNEPGSTWAHGGLNLGSTWAQPGLNPGSFSNEPNVRKPAQFRVNVRPALNSRETSWRRKTSLLL